VRLAPDVEPVGRRSDEAVAVGLPSLDLKPALAAILATDRIVIDRRIDTKVVAGLAPEATDGVHRA
jgi:hypothetical protein